MRPKTILINYANDYFRKSQILNSTTGNQIGLFDEIITYSPRDIGADLF